MESGDVLLQFGPQRQMQAREGWQSDTPSLLIIRGYIIFKHSEFLKHLMSFSECSILQVIRRFQEGLRFTSRWSPELEAGSTGIWKASEIM